MRAGRAAAAGVAAVTIGLNAGTIWTLFGTDFLDRFRGPGFTDIDYAILDAVVVEFAAVTLAYVFVGFLLAGRPGAGRIAAVLVAGGALFAAIPFGYSVGAQLAFHAPQSELANAVFLLGPLAVDPGYALILPGLALVFPTGRLPSRRWDLPVGLVAGPIAVGTCIQLILPGQVAPGTPGSRNPLGIEGLPDGLSAVSGALVAFGVSGVMILGVTAVLTRYRIGDGIQRQQLRWFMAAVLVAAVPLPIAILPGIGGPQWAAVAFVGLLLIPVSVWIAVTRYRLYEIDRLISRGVSWAVLSGLLVAAYVGAVLVLQGVLGGVTQGQTVAVAASTLLAAALFQPLRRRIQSVVDRRFDRARYDADRTAEAFAVRLRDEVDPADIRATLLVAVGRAVAPSRVHLWLRERPR